MLSVMLSSAGADGATWAAEAGQAAWPVRTLVQKFRKEFEQRIGEQESGAAEKRIRETNPAAYELPILGAASART